MSFICPICNQQCKSNQKSIQCTSCLGWVHHNNRNNCSGITNTEFHDHCNNIGKYFECDKCCSKSICFLPFSKLDDNDWLTFNEIKTNYVSDDVNMINTAEDINFISQCGSIQNSFNFANDNDNDTLFSSRVNSNYYDIKEFNSKLKIDLPSSFGLFHVNIASLNKHIGDLKLILSLLNYKFDIIGISEHNIFKDTLPSNNIKIPGYNEFIFVPTETSHGGTGFFIKDNIDFISRKDLQINCPSNFETIFIEVQFPKRKNLIVGCVYRHPQSNISIHDFTNLYFDPILQKIV